MSPRLPFVLAVAAVAAGALASAPATASLIVALDTPTMVSEANHIAVVDVVSVKADWDANHERILSTIDLAVVESWKGEMAPAARIKVVQPGGTVGDITMVVSGMTRFAPGERALVFLRGRPEDAAVVGMAQGKRVVHKDAATGRWLVHAPDRAGASFVRPAAPATPPAAAPALPVFEGRVRPLDDVRTEIRQLLSQGQDAMTRAGRGVALAVLAGAALGSRPAAAYVRYKTADGTGFFWPQSCVLITVYPNDLPYMTPEQSVHATTAAADTWSSVGDPCTFLNLVVSSSDAPSPTARFDYYNSVIFRHDTWCRPTDAPGTCSYDPAALAITSVFVATKSGEIRDGDVEVNAKNFVWADVDIDPTGGRQDLQNALTHEFGHLIGLDHTCYIPQPKVARPFDNLGSPVPDCDAADDAVRATTMFASAIPGDVEKRSLAPDDQLAVCEVYPVAADPKTCPPPGPPPDERRLGCGCALGGRSSTAPAAALLAAAAALLGTRRSRRRGSRARRARRARRGG